jgi:hypothetical protein
LRRGRVCPTRKQNRFTISLQKKCGDCLTSNPSCGIMNTTNERGVKKNV